MKLIFGLLALGLTGCQLFKAKPTSSDYFKPAWEKAQIELKNNNLQSAEMMLKEIYQLGLEAAPEYSVLSLYELAKLNEQRGEWEIAISRLKECELKLKLLPTVQADLELPAKLAGLYAAVGEIRISESYTKLAEKGLAIYSVQLRPDLQSSWWAETLYKMGSFPTNSMTEENWPAFAKRFESGSIHLLRSLEYSDPIWSEKSYQQLDSFFKKSIEILDGATLVQDDNWWIKKTVIREKLDTLLFLIHKLKLWRPLKVKDFKYSTQFYRELIQTEKYLIQARLQFVDVTPLTIENLKRKQIKREDLEVKE
jgi:hypothetical protein